MSDLTPHLIIRPPRDADEGLRFFQLAAVALTGPRSGAAEWLEREGLENVRLAVAGDEILGGLAVQRMGQWFGGRSVPCGVVRAVAVAAGARGKGVALRLVTEALAELRAAGLPLAMLFASTYQLYRRAGFEQAGLLLESTIPVADLPHGGDGDDDLEVREIDLADPALPRLYAEAARRSNGLLDRNAWLWRRTLEAPLAKLELTAYLLGPREAPEGYLVTHIERAEDMLRSTLVLRDRALLTPRAVRRAASLLAGHRSVIELARFPSASVDPLLFLGANPRHEVVRQEAWMLRLTDVTGALEARGYSAGVDAEVHLQVRDPSLPPTPQRLVLRVQNGVGSVWPGGRGAVEVDARGLAALYSGFLAPTEVAALGLLSGDPVEAAPLAAIFAGPAPWVHEIV